MAPLPYTHLRLMTTTLFLLALFPFWAFCLPTAVAANISPSQILPAHSNAASRILIPSDTYPTVTDTLPAAALPNEAEPSHDSQGRHRQKEEYLRRRDPPVYTPIVTAAPDQEEQLAKQGFRQETFYTCQTVGGNGHCGWHVPIMKAEGARTETGVVVAGVACLAGIFVMGLM